MAEHPIIQARERSERGKRAARRLRAEGRVPAVVYGPGMPTQLLSVDSGRLRELVEHRAKMVELKIGRRGQPAVIKEVQFDHLGSDIQHVDFEGISLTETIRLEVPIETHGTPRGVRNGGVLEVTHRHVTVECLPAEVPNEITVEVGDLDIGATVTVGQLPQSPGVTILDEPSTVAVTIHPPRKAVEEEVEVAEEEVAEPEVISAKKEEEGEETQES